MNAKDRPLDENPTSTEVEVRIAAVRELSGRNFSIGPLLPFLGDGEWRVRKAAIESFFQLPHPENLAAEVIELLHHQDNAGLRNAAIEILVGLGPLAIEELRHEIDCTDVEVRKFVIDILGEIGDPRCERELVAALCDSDNNVRYAAVETLGKLKIVLAVDPLLKLMSDPDPGLKFTILQALAQIGGELPLARLVTHLNDRLLRKALFDCFGKIGGVEVVPFLLEGLVDPMRNVREAALTALFALRADQAKAIAASLRSADSARIAEFLEQLLAGQNPQLKEAALALYGQVGRGRDLRCLLSCVPDERLRGAALSAFATLGETAYIELAESLVAPDAQELLCLVFVGGELGFKSVLQLAFEASCSDDPHLRSAAVRAIGELGGETQIGLLLDLLDDETGEVRDAATLALGALGGREHQSVKERLVPLLSDSDVEKRVRILRVLGRINGPGTEELLLKSFKDSSSSVRCEAVRGLSGMDSPSVVAGLTLALTDESAEVRRLAVDALGHCSQDRVLSALALASGDNDLWVRSAVMRALQQYRGENVRDLLLQGCADPVGPVAIAALETIAMILPGEARERLELALAHADEEVVKAAMKQLDRIYPQDWILPYYDDLLNHSHWDVRAATAKVIGHSARPEFIGRLEERLLVEGDALVCQALEAAIARCLRARSRNE